jgi:hypothetical protein
MKSTTRPTVRIGAGIRRSVAKKAAARSDGGSASTVKGDLRELREEIEVLSRKADRLLARLA